MKITTFSAEADIVGRRLRVGWDFVLEGLDTLADIPPVTLRRKTRDFEFPPPSVPDPYEVFAGATFPPVPNPPNLLVTDLPGWTIRGDGLETQVEVVSVAVNVGPRAVEALRCTTATTYNTDGLPVKRRLEILDSGPLPSGLQPGTTYYYQLTSPLSPSVFPTGPLAATATAGESYGLNRTLYGLLPEIYRRHDVITRPPTVGSDTVPEASTQGGQLRRMVDIFGLPLDLMRSGAENLRTLREIDRVDARFLPLLATWIGWELDQETNIPLWRNEIKSAPALYRGVGTVPALRAIVNRYTGWNTQVAEFAQQIMRANMPAHFSLFALRQVAGEWQGVDDGSMELGFGVGNDQATGNGGPALLTSTLTEPFALRPGMTFTLASDNNLPESVRFDLADFANLGAATAAEVAATLNRLLGLATVEATAAGAIRLRSRTSGLTSTLQVSHPGEDLVTLEGAPGGRLSTVLDSQARLRLFYAATELNAPPVAHGGAFQIRYKSFAYNEWRSSRPLFATEVNAADPPTRAAPAALQLPNGNLWLAWIEYPHTPLARLRAMQGAVAAPQPARITGQRRGPFNVPPGARVALRGHWAGTDLCTFQPADFVNAQNASAAEVVTALNASLNHVTASVLANGAIRLETIATGPTARLELDLRQSLGIQALGLDARTRRAEGSWDDTITWASENSTSGLPLPEVLSAPGRYEGLTALRDSQEGLRLFWSSHRHGLWRIFSRRSDSQVWVATANGVSLLLSNGTWTTLTSADGLVDDDVVAVAVDADGGAWFATPNGVSVRRANGTWSSFTVVDGLGDDNVRDLAPDWDGGVWFATAAGVSVQDEGGNWATFTTGDGLGDNDVRGVMIDPDGLPWVATAGGVSRRLVNGDWINITTAQGLPSNDTRAISFGPTEQAWVATAGGIARFDPATNQWQAFTTADGLPSNDIRAIDHGMEGSTWVATAAGLAHRQVGASWQIITSSDGLPSNDVRTVAVAANGAVWVATPAGVALRSPTGPWITLTTTQGLATNDVRDLHLTWSSVRQFAAGQGANLEPNAVEAAGGALWLFWSRRMGIGTMDDTWTLRQRIYDPATALWGAEQEVIAPPMGGRAADREPSAVLMPGNLLTLFFRSDRSGENGIWSALPDPNGPASGVTEVIHRDADARAPAPLLMGTVPWLIFRSSRSVALGQLSPRPNPAAPERASAPLPDSGAIRRQAGATTIVAAALLRNRRRQLWDDLLAYTAQRPAGDPLRNDELYTRGTLGLYVSRPNDDTPITPQSVQRLRQLLARFLPINTRAVVILTPQMETELVYPGGVGPDDSYFDQYPFVEILGGLADNVAAALPDWAILFSNQLGQGSADPANLLTLRRRTYYPPPQ